MFGDSCGLDFKKKFRKHAASNGVVPLNAVPCTGLSKELIQNNKTR